MSWSVSAIGRAAAVAESISKQISQTKCAEPEETVKNKVNDIVAAALAGFPDKYAVEVKASGSQSLVNYTKPELGSTNSLNVEIKPIYSFLV